MLKMNLQNYVSMASALIVFIGGLALIFMYPGGMSSQLKVLIGLLVTFYFFARMAQTIFAIKSERNKAKSELKGTINSDEGGSDRTKSS
jgi:hypothetical protein